MRTVSILTAVLLTTLLMWVSVAKGQSSQPAALDLSIKGRMVSAQWDPATIPFGNPKPRSILVEVMLDEEVIESRSISTGEASFSLELGGDLSCKSGDISVNLVNLNGDLLGTAGKKIAFPCYQNITAIIPGWNHAATTGYRWEGAGIFIGSIGLAGWAVYEFQQFNEFRQDPFILSTAGTQLLTTAAATEQYQNTLADYKAARNQVYLALSANLLVYGARYLWEGPLANNRKRAKARQSDLISSQWEAERPYRSILPSMGYSTGAYSFGFNFTF